MAYTETWRMRRGRKRVRKDCANCGHHKSAHAYAPSPDGLTILGPQCCVVPNCDCTLYVQALPYQRVKRKGGTATMRPFIIAEHRRDLPSAAIGCGAVRHFRPSTLRGYSGRAAYPYHAQHDCIGLRGDPTSYTGPDGVNRLAL